MGILSNVEEELIPELPRFFENYSDDIENLKEYVDDRNAEEIENIVHRMKGSSGSWGFQAIHEATVKLENAARDRNWDSIQSSLETLENKVDKAKKVVDEKLNES